MNAIDFFLEVNKCHDLVYVETVVKKGFYYRQMKIDKT
jgi:hypothetical protein